LRDVFGVGDRTRKPPRQAMDAIVMTPQEALESVAISSRGKRCEVTIGVGAGLGVSRS
jgi:hypothetical protein